MQRIRNEHSSQTKDVFDRMYEMNSNCRVLHKMTAEARDHMAQKRKDQAERQWRKMNPVQPTDGQDDLVVKPMVLTEAMLFNEKINTLAESKEERRLREMGYELPKKKSQFIK